MKYYSTTLFNEIFKELKKNNSLKNELFVFNGIWAFSYLKGANSLKTAFFKVVKSISISKEDSKIIKSTIIDCDHGSLGFSFSKLTGDNNKEIDVLLDTFEDPRGVVCYLDTKIKQQHAIFVIIKNKKNHNEILGMLDLFFSSNNTDGLEENLKNIIGAIFKKNDFKRLCVNTFKIYQFENIVGIEKESLIDTKPKNQLNLAINKIEKYICASVTTPVFYFKVLNEPINSNLVGTNFNYIHSLINHEYRFCSLVNKRDNCYFIDSINSGHHCHNPFLNLFYFNIILKLDCSSYKHQFLIDEDKYTVEFIYRRKIPVIELSSLITEVNKSSRLFDTDFPGHGDISTKKLRDELVFLQFKTQLKGKSDILSIILYREPVPFYGLNIHYCTIEERSNIRNIKQFISPSHLLYSQSKCEISADQPWSKREDGQTNVVNFEIVNSEMFLEALKKEISVSYNQYFDAIKPYLSDTLTTSPLNINESLELFFVGANPIDSNEIYDALIKEQINLIASLIQEKITLVYATRAAISQVLARNMSHNIGSHVLSNMVTDFSVKRHFNTKIQYKSLFNDSLYVDKTKTINNNWKLANFNSYLRTRMDFLADIATGQPAMEVTRLLVRDVIGEIDKNRILLNHISGVDDFSYSIVVKDCRKFKLTNCTNPKCGRNGNDKDIQVSIPNGIMGYHALFILFENIIRNTAKHQGANNKKDKKNKKNKIFTLEIRDSIVDNTLYEALIYDNVEIDGELNVDEQFYKEHVKQDYDPTKNIFRSHLDWLVFQQNCRINDPVINLSTNRLREGAWGLIEMDASAAYLRKLSPETIDEDIYNLNLVNEEVRTDDSSRHLNILKAVKKGNHLAYRFHMMKPKELLVVDETGKLYNELQMPGKGNKTLYNELLENGIWVVQHTCPNEDNYFDINSVYAHPFMLIIASDEFVEDRYLYIEQGGKQVFRGNLPSRIIVCKDRILNDPENSLWVAYIACNHELMNNLKGLEGLSRKIDNEDDLMRQTLMDRVWQVWLENKVNIHKIRIENQDIGRKINQYLLNYQSTNPFSIFIAKHGGSRSDIANRAKHDHFLAYPSSVEPFIDSAKNDRITSDLIANALFDKICLAILTDSFLTNILIIDERVQLAWENKYGSTGIKHNELFKCGGQFIPLKAEIDLSKQTYEPGYWEEIKKLISTIEKEGKLKGLDYIVIHLGVIEKMLTVNGLPKKQENVMNYISELQEMLDSKIRIVITSGRGKPDNLPEQIPFVSFSTLSQYAIETPFKPFLNQILQNARTFKN